MNDATKMQIFRTAYNEEWDLRFHWVLDHPTQVQHEYRHGRADAMIHLIDVLGLTGQYETWKTEQARKYSA